MNHFIELGTHYFEGSEYENGILTFERKGYFGADVPHPWHVYTYEPSIHAVTANLAHLEKLAARFAHFEAHHAAVMDRDGTVEFRWCPENEAGSNCTGESIEEVSEVGSQLMTVEAIDIRRIVKAILKRDVDARITVKCDIEGSEFRVLPRLLDLGLVETWLQEVFVEWHDRFWVGKANHGEILRTRASIEAECRYRGIVLHDWE